MDLSGSRRIAADRAAVWAALNDPDVLKAAIPGCRRLEGDPASGFEATVARRIGPIDAAFHGRIEISNRVEGRSCTIAGAGKGGAAGFARGVAEVRLEEVEGGTRLGYEVRAVLEGRIAQLGAGLIDGLAAKMADQFFERFRKAVEAPGAPPAAAPEAGGKRPGWLRRLARKG